MTVKDKKTGAYIMWTDGPAFGHDKPITRVWCGPCPIDGNMVTSECGDTPEGRDKEVAWLVGEMGWTKQ